MIKRLGRFPACFAAFAALLLSATSGLAASRSFVSPSGNIAMAPTIVSNSAPNSEPNALLDPNVLYDAAGLSGSVSRAAFEAAYESMTAHGLDASTGTLAIADMTQPSTAQRLVLVDLKSRALRLRTWVAHGSGTGGLMAKRFSNREGSHATSLGLYRVGSRIVSPKHGPALLLHGLDRGVNDQARSREVIIHGADYVSQDFISRTGRLGRSWGCPVVPHAELKRVIAALEGDGLLYVHGA